MVKQIAEHSVETNLIGLSAKVLDLGCRGFEFAIGMAAIGCEVYCVDADPEVKPPANIGYLNYAVTTMNRGDVWLHKFGNGTGNYVKLTPGVPRKEWYKVHSADLARVSKEFDVDYWDLIKFDIEGCEVDILLALTEPPATQLSIEFHEHCGRTRNETLAVFAHLAQWYNLVAYELCSKHGCGENYWDCLFVRKIKTIEEIRINEVSLLNGGNHGIGYNIIK